MCGRYVHPDQAAIERAWHIGRSNSNPFAERFNVLPTTTVPVLRLDEGTLELTGARWGFIPHWWKDAKLPRLTLNARSEEAAIKPMWRHAYARNRCLLPALGWYEWREVEEVDQSTGEVRARKQPYFIHRLDSKPFAFAGLLSNRSPSSNAPPELSCAILTRAAAPGLSQVHDRMPVVLPQSLHSAWIDPALVQPAAVTRMIADAENDFAFHAVSMRVNGRLAQGPELVQPL